MDRYSAADRRHSEPGPTNCTRKSGRTASTPREKAAGTGKPVSWAAPSGAEETASFQSRTSHPATVSTPAATPPPTSSTPAVRRRRWRRASSSAAADWTAAVRNCRKSSESCKSSEAGNSWQRGPAGTIEPLVTPD